jgi:6-phosphogluconolactonase (cycloisomerase 2 family)
MRLLSHMSLSLAVLAVVLAGPANASAHDRTAHGVAGHSTGYVYLDNNTAGTNTISGFGRSANGALTALPGSPFVAGGSGLGAGIASQGAIRTADDGRYLLAADAGSNQISVLRIGADGSLTPVPGSPFASGGVEPDSIAVNNGLVYVSDTGAGGTNYTGFTLSPAGQLHPIPGSTVTLPDGSGPGDVVLNADNTKLVGTRVNTSLIDSFTLNRDGRPHAAPGSPYAAQGIGPFGSEFRPTPPDQLFVANAHNGAGLGTVSAYDDLRDGTLSPIGASPFADFQTAPCWLVVSPDGQYVYALDTGSAEISSYAIARDGTLTLLSNTPISSTPGVTGTDIALSADGRTLYLNMARVNGVGEFAVHGGTVRQLPGSPVPASGSGSTVGITTS